MGNSEDSQMGRTPSVCSSLKSVPIPRPNFLNEMRETATLYLQPVVFEASGKKSFSEMRSPSVKTDMWNLYCTIVPGTVPCRVQNSSFLFLEFHQHDGNN